MPQAKPIVVTEELRQRLSENFDRTDGCWEWRGARSSDTGYGCLWIGGVNGRRLYAHRAVYTLLVGPVPNDLVIDHLCRNRGCVNPDHLEPVTSGENVRRGDAPTVKIKREGKCLRGHARQPENVGAGGHCKRCEADKAKERRASREAADPSLREARLAGYRRAYQERQRRAA